METVIGWLAKYVKLQECGCKDLIESEILKKMKDQISDIFKNKLSYNYYDREHQLIEHQECGKHCKNQIEFERLKKRTKLQDQLSRIFKNELSEKFYDLEHQLLHCTEKHNHAKIWQCWYQNIVGGKKFNLPQIQTAVSLRCPSCGLKLSKKWNLERHLKTCKPVSLKCPYCGKALTKRWILQRHLKTCKLFAKK